MDNLSSYRLFRISARVPNETEQKAVFVNVLHNGYYVNHTRNVLTVSTLGVSCSFWFVSAQ